MTNHPRRVGRRKHQRQAARRWTDLTPYVTAVRLGAGRPWVPHSIAVAPAGTPPHRIHVHRWGNGQIETTHVPAPRQQQLKEPA